MILIRVYSSHSLFLTPLMPSLRIGMGSWVAIDAAANSPSAAAAAIAAAFAAVSDVEHWMHPQRNGSDLARINRADLGERLEVRQDTWALLALAKQINALSDGVFDPCLPSRPGCLADIELQAPNVVVCTVPVALDLGGIAKGYAVDQATDTLTAQGCSAGLVNAGGDVRVFGSQREKLLLRHANGSLSPLHLANAAIAVSELDCRGRPSEHQGYYVRGKSLSPRFRHAAVIARNATLADALVKCVLLCPAATTRNLLRVFDAATPTLAIT